MMVVLLAIVASGTAMSLGTSYGSLEGAWEAFFLLCLVVLPTLAVVYVSSSKKAASIQPMVAQYKERISQLTEKYNNKIDRLEHTFQSDSTGMNAIKAELLREKYEKKYSELRRDYQNEQEIFLSDLKDKAPQFVQLQTKWKKLLTFSCIALVTAGAYSMGAMDANDNRQAAYSETGIESLSTTEDGQRYWNAESIPIPYLTDSTRRVSNPDHVVSNNTEWQLNAMLQRMDAELKLQTVMILVNHIENDDPYRFAQQVGNKYGVGRNDRGLLIVLAYQDHAINISPGKGLEGELTDSESGKLERRYAVPSMRAELPDSGMLYLTKAIYRLLQKKQLPEMPTLNSETTDASIVGLSGLYLLLIVSWILLLVYVNRRYLLFSASRLRSNPFVRNDDDASATGAALGAASMFGGHGGGGGFGGGSFGGGSFGGGGATSRW